MAALALQLCKQLGAYLEPFGIRVDIRIDKRIIHFVQCREVPLNRRGLLFREVERGHARREPGTQLHNRRIFQERMQPQGLSFEALSIEVRRPLRLFLCWTYVATCALDDMASPAILFRQQLPATGNSLCGLVTHFERDRILHQADEHTRDRVDFLITEVEVRHLQEFFRPLDAPDIEDAWIFQLLLVPAAPGVFDR